MFFSPSLGRLARGNFLGQVKATAVIYLVQITATFERGAAVYIFVLGLLGQFFRRLYHNFIENKVTLAFKIFLFLVVSYIPFFYSSLRCGNVSCIERCGARV